MSLRYLSAFLGMTSNVIKLANSISMVIMANNKFKKLEVWFDRLKKLNKLIMNNKELDAAVTNIISSNYPFFPVALVFSVYDYLISKDLTRTTPVTAIISP